MLVEAGHGGGLDRLGRPRAAPPSRAPRRRRRPAWRGWCAVAWPRLRAQLAVAQRRRGRRRGTTGRRAGARRPAARVGQPEEHGRSSRHRRGRGWCGADDGPRSRRGSRPGAPCGCPSAAGTGRRRCASGRTRRRRCTTSACVREHVAHLVGEHRGRGVGVLDRERAAEAAALVGAGQLDQVEAAHRAQQPQRPVAHPQQPQRVAGRVVGDPVRVVGADVGRRRARRPGTRDSS